MKQTRKAGKQAEGKAILIYCEGEKTEKNYFDSFKEHLKFYLIEKRVKIDTKGEGYNTLSLVEEVIRLKKKAARSGSAYDIIWAVFDKDSNSNENFNAAIALAERNNIKVAYSNEAFELWYLLHFNYHDAAIARDLYFDKLTEKLGSKYRKNDASIFVKILDKQNDAIRNAIRLLDAYTPSKPAQDNPSTTVHKLVEFLNGFKTM
jgi:hypothetical protein